MQWVNLKTKQWRRPNLVCNAKEKPMNKKIKWPSKQKTMHLPLGPCKISSMCDVNQKPCQEWYKRRNGHVIYLKWFFETHLFLFFFFFANYTTKECKPPRSKERTPMPTLNGLKKDIWKLLELMPPIKTSDN